MCRKAVNQSINQSIDSLKFFLNFWRNLVTQLLLILPEADGCNKRETGNTIRRMLCTLALYGFTKTDFLLS